MQLEGEDSHGACFSIRSIVVVGQLSTIPVSSWDLKSNKSQDTQGARLKLYSWRMFNNIKYSYFSQEYPFNIEYYAFHILCFHTSQPYYFDIEFYTLTFDFFIFPICTLLLLFFTNTSAISTIFSQYIQNIREILQLWVKPCWQQVATMNHWQTDKGRSFIRDVWRISKNCTKAFKHKYKSKVFVSHF